MASKSLGTLTLDLIARVGGFVKGMDAAERASDKWRKKVKSNLQKTNKAIGNFATAATKLYAGAVVGLGALVVSTVKAAKETQQLSKVANTGVQDFQKFAYASKRYGVEQEKVADILKDVNDKVGDFLQTGGGPLKDFFEKIAPQVGVTAEQFKNLSGDQALQLYVDSLEKANVSQADMIFYMEAIASDSTKLLPLLQNSGKELKALGDKAEKTGAVFDELEFNQLIEADKGIKELQNTFSGLKNEIVIAALPAIKDLIGTLNDPQTQAGLKDLATSFVKLTGVIAKSAAAAGEFFAAVNFVFNRDFDDKNIVDVWDKLGGLRKEHASLKKAISSPLAPKRWLSGWADEIDKLEKEIKRLEVLEENWNKRGNTQSFDLFGSGGDFEKDIAGQVSAYKSAQDEVAATEEKNRLEKFKADQEKAKLEKQRLKAAEKAAKQQEAARKEAQRLTDSIKEQVAEWKQSAEWVGKDADEIARLTLEQMGANEAQVESVKIAQDAIKAYEDRQRAQQDYQALIQSLRTDEEVLTDQLRERLKVLEDMAQISGEGLNQEALERIIDGSFSESGETGDISNQEGIEDAKKELEDWYSEQLDLLDTFRQERSDLNEEWDEKELELKQEHQDRLNEIEAEAEQIRQERIAQGYSSLLDVMGAYFDGMEGKEAAYARAAIQIGKTLLDEKKRDALTQLWADTHSAAMGAYNAMASIPYVGPVLGAAAAGAVYVAGGSAAAGILGLAHDGMDSIPQTGTWYLEKGERVTTEKTSAKLDKTLDNVISSLDTGTTNNRTATVNQNINITGKVDKRTSRQMQQDAAKKQRMTERRLGV